MPDRERDVESPARISICLWSELFVIRTLTHGVIASSINKGNTLPLQIKIFICKTQSLPYFIFLNRAKLCIWGDGWGTSTFARNFEHTCLKNSIYTLPEKWKIICHTCRLIPAPPPSNSLVSHICGLSMPPKGNMPVFCCHIVSMLQYSC